MTLFIFVQDPPASKQQNFGIHVFEQLNGAKKLTRLGERRGRND